MIEAVRGTPQRGNDGRVPEGKRNSYLTSVAGSMRHAGLNAEAMYAALRVANAEQCDPPLQEVEVQGVARSVARYSAGPTLMGEIGLVKRLADQITAIDHFAQDAGGKLYRFTNGVYRGMAVTTLDAW
jgi:Primase C terminal 1 (PriCT-1)